MKREIKCRVWLNGRFQYFDLHNTIDSAQINAINLAAIKGVRWEQYIGLKDRRVREIYEGDIYQEYWGDLEGDKLKVVFDEADACFCGCDSKGHLHFLLDPSNMVIIGNVHENPDLL